MGSVQPPRHVDANRVRRGLLRLDDRTRVRPDLPRGRDRRRLDHDLRALRRHDRRKCRKRRYHLRLPARRGRSRRPRPRRDLLERRLDRRLLRRRVRQCYAALRWYHHFLGRMAIRPYDDDDVLPTAIAGGFF